jgi:hypothetical protein
MTKKATTVELHFQNSPEELDEHGSNRKLFDGLERRLETFEKSVRAFGKEHGVLIEVRSVFKFIKQEAKKKKVIPKKP